MNSKENLWDIREEGRLIEPILRVVMSNQSNQIVVMQGIKCKQRVGKTGVKQDIITIFLESCFHGNKDRT